MKRKSLKKIPKDRIGYDHWTRSYMKTGKEVKEMPEPSGYKSLN